EVSIDVRPGELLAIVTSEAAESQALASLFAFDAPPEAGTVRLDGQPLTDIDLAAARAALVLAPHDATLVAGTLRENFVPLTLSEERVAAVADATATDTVVAELSGGWETL